MIIFGTRGVRYSAGNGEFLVAVADGTIQDEEQRLLEGIAAALEMSPSHVCGVLDSMCQRQ